MARWMISSECGEEAHAAGCGCDEFEFFRRMHRAFAGERRVEAQHEAAAERSIRRTAGRVMRMKTSMGPARRRERFARRAAGRGTWDEFAEENFKVGDGGEGDDDRDGVCVEDGVGREDVEPVRGEVEQHLATALLPSQPRASEARVTPNWTAGRKSSMFCLSWSAVRAPGRPRARSCCMRALRAHADESEFGGDEEAAWPG